MDFRHATVLKDEVAGLLSPKEGAVVLDGTLGGGGHAEALLEKGATVLGLDRDPAAIAAATTRLSARFGARFSTELARFSEAREVLARRGMPGVDGAVLDLGVSSPQIDDPERGFSFGNDGPLDMRMGREGQTAAELIAGADEAELEEILKEYGEEPFARRVARAIKSALPVPTRTAELADVVARAIPRKAWPKHIHPATRTFQALRIAVNRELDELDRFMADLPQILNVGGRAAVISFHSLEDRRVKQAFRNLEGRCTCPPKLPQCVCGARGNFESLTKKAVVASEDEVAANPRSRSARLRAVKRVR
ncbi:MAG TPA: 16S rRNA (cytosine(1402)-N(4))-methyltransferase RsmH [Myxococcales bacterium]|jgi:16S rRNA (cytosine1402-N4)-methyltransferase